MKKSFYFLMMFIGLAFTSCEPVEDLHEQVQADLDARPNFGNVEFTFSDDDYEELDLNFGNFNSVDHANELIPGYLSNRYPVLGRGSIANVTVDIYNPAQELENFEEYEVTEEEYAELGFNYGNFSRDSHIITFLNHKYPNASEGDAVELTYEYFAGGNTSTRTTTHVNVGDGSWIQAVTLERADYNEMGESFPNFSNREDAISKLSTFLDIRYPYAAAEDTKAVIYDLHIGGGNTVKQLAEFTFDGDSWSAPGSTYQTTLQFGHDGDGWEPDNTIMYTLKSADYEAIGDALEDEYVDPAWSVGNYENFDRREGNRNYWDIDMLVEAMNVVLDRIDPNAEEGQKYVVTFDIYDGSPGTETLSLIKEGGEWVLNQ